MADEAIPVGFDEVQRRFAALRQAISTNGETLRSTDERQLLVDQVRDALDRGEERLSDNKTTIVANTFVLEDMIHRGTHTEVCRARHRDLGTYHAIKMLRPDHSGNLLAQRMLLREAAIGLPLRHTNIVATQALLRLNDGCPALVFEWSGNSLAEFLRQGPIPISAIKALMTGVLSGLASLHDAGVVHCDVSPSNLLLDGKRPETVRLADFGVALEIGKRHADLDLSFAGQPDFAAPEQRAGKPIDGRCDLYAAGRLLSLLLDMCSESTDGSPLYVLAAHLSQPSRDARPENGRAAAALFSL